MISFTNVTSMFFSVSRRTVGKLGACALAGVMSLSMAQTASASSQPDFDKSAFLSAIAEVETGGNPRAVGRQGERGLYQFRSGVWKQYTSRSFFQAHNPDVSYGVAVKHFDWLYDGFVRNGRQPTAFMMAAAWNSGLNRALSGRLPSGTRSYAQRVANIITVSEAQQVAWLDGPRFHIRTAID
jgi:hypothetical protein